MALIEVNLERPALKRVEELPADEREEGTSIGIGTESEEMERVESGETTEGTAESAGGGGALRKLVAIAAMVGAMVAVRRWRTMQGGEDVETEIGIDEMEEPSATEE